MRLIEVVRRPDDGQREQLVRFVEHAAAHLGRRPLSDHLWLDLQAGGGPGFISARIADDTSTLAIAQISAANDGAVIEAVTEPGLDDGDALTARDAAVDAAVDDYRRHGGGRLAWWLDDPTDHDRATADELGLTPWRTLYEMRRPLPHELHATVETRSFRPGLDDEAWLSVNNRAFAEHGEQGGWTAETLALRVDEDWFDADGFRIHDADGRMAAFCWTKIHHDADPVTGEIYVIAVDPDFHGRGLGKELTLAGLDSIAARGITTANLYVDGGNTAAVGLYERLGFHIHRERVAFAGDLPPID